MAVQAALGSDIALVFDECTPVPRRPRLHGALDRAHPPLARPLPRLARRARAAGARRCSGSSRAASTRTCAARRPSAVSAADVDGLAIGGTLGRDKAEMHGVLAMTAPMLPGRRAEAPARDRRARRPARRDRARASTSSTAPSRPGSPATGWRSRRCPDVALSLRRRARRRSPPTRARWSRAARARPAPAHTRAYLHYLVARRGADRRRAC